MELTDENIKKMHRLILFTVVAVVCVWKYEVSLSILSFIWKVVFPFILGGTIAFILNVPMNFIQTHLFAEERLKKHCIIKKLARLISMLIVFFVLAIIVGIIIFILVPRLGVTFAHLGSSIRQFIPEIQKWAGILSHNNKEVMNVISKLEFDWNKIMNVGLGYLGMGTENVLGSTINVAKNVINGMTTFFIAFAFSIYILLQKEKLKKQSEKVLFAFVREGRAEATLEVLALTYKTFSNFLTGQCVEAIILGGMFVASMIVLKLPYALLIGILIAFTALVPIFGAFIGCFVGTFLIFMVDPGKAVGFVILFLVLQQIEGNFIYPHVVGNSVGLPSIWVLAAVSIGARLMGIVGMLIFIPIVSVVYALFREVVYLQLKKRGMEERF